MKTSIEQPKSRRGGRITKTENQEEKEMKTNDEKHNECQTVEEERKEKKT